MNRRLSQKTELFKKVNNIFKLQRVYPLEFEKKEADLTFETSSEKDR
jgi:hypothetical protein